MTKDNTGKFINVNTPYFDTYGIVRIGTNELNSEIVKIFDSIIRKKEFALNEQDALKEIIKNAFAKKKQTSSYSEMDITLLNWDFVFFKYLINNSLK